MGDILVKFCLKKDFTVHPHACGGYSVSPDSFGAKVRFTPTHVGDISCIEFNLFKASGSPPRMWGICDKEGILDVGKRGSPPRMWGILVEP